MKRFILGLITGAIITSLLLPAQVLAELPIRLVINDKQVESDVLPRIIDNRLMVPVRVIAEQLGADVNWVSEQNTVYIKTKATQVNTPQPSVQPTPPAAPTIPTMPTNKTNKTYKYGKITVVVKNSIFKVSNVGFDSESRYKIHGTIENVSDQESNIMVYGYAYDSNGKQLLGMNDVIFSIKPHETSDFNVNFIGLEFDNVSVDHYKVEIQTIYDTWAEKD